MSIKKCGECGSDVSTKAKACPACGAPVVSLWKYRFIALGIAVFVLLASLSKPTHKEEQTTSTEGFRVGSDLELQHAASPVETQPKAKEPFVASEFNLTANRLAMEYLRTEGGSSGELSSAFGILTQLQKANSEDLGYQSETNIAALDNRYKDKRLLIYATVLGINKNPSGKEYIVQLHNGIAVFDKSDFVSTLHPGAMSIFVCTYRVGISLAGYGLDGCRSMIQEAENVGAMTALQPPALGSAGRSEFETFKSQALASAKTAPDFCLSHVSIENCGAEVGAPVDPP